VTGPQAQQVASSAPARAGISLRLAWWGLGALALAALLALGFQRQARTRQAVAVRPTLRLHFGEPAPHFSLASLAGGKVTSDSLKGKWTLLAFGSSSCPFMEKALKALNAFQEKQREQVRVVCIAPESEFAAKRLTRWAALPVLLDPGRVLHSAYLDNPWQTPSFVLLDPAGRVRFVEQGYRMDYKGKSAFAALLSEFFDDERPLFKPLGSTSDGVVVVGGSKKRLSELWAGSTLVLIFTAPGQPLSLSLMGRAEKYRDAPESMKFLFLSPVEPAARWKRLPVKGPRFLAGWDETGALAAAYDVRTFPRIFMIRDGFVLGKQGETCGSCGAPWEQVAEAALFTCSPGREGGDRT